MPWPRATRTVHFGFPSPNWTTCSKNISLLYSKVAFWTRPSKNFFHHRWYSDKSWFDSDKYDPT
jgi:hypothetical protein